MLYECLQVGIEGLQILKPNAAKGILQSGFPVEGVKEPFETSGGINCEVRILVPEEDAHDVIEKWMVENFKFSVKQPVIDLNFLNIIFLVICTFIMKVLSYADFYSVD